MAQPNARLLATILVGSAVLMGALGAYRLVVRGNAPVGIALMVVAIVDLGIATFFAQRG